MSTEQNHQRGLLVGALIGAILGAGIAHLLLTAPSGENEADKEPVTAKDLLGLTNTAASLIGKLDDVRRRT